MNNSKIEVKIQDYIDILNSKEVQSYLSNNDFINSSVEDLKSWKRLGIKLDLSPLGQVLKNAPTTCKSEYEESTDSDYTDWAENVYKTVAKIRESAVGVLTEAARAEKATKKIKWSGIIVSILITVIGAVLMYIFKLHNVGNGTDIASYGVERFSDFLETLASALPSGAVGGGAVSTVGVMACQRKDKSISSNRLFKGIPIFTFVICLLAVVLVWLFWLTGFVERYTGRQVANVIYLITFIVAAIIILCITIFSGMNIKPKTVEANSAEATLSEE